MKGCKRDKTEWKGQTDVQVVNVKGHNGIMAIKNKALCPSGALRTASRSRESGRGAQLPLSSFIGRVVSIVTTIIRFSEILESNEEKETDESKKRRTNEE
jgi:hypothetical protein